MNIRVFYSPAEIAELISRQLLKSADQKADKGNNFFLAVSGGSTPKILFQRLSEEPYNTKIKWSNLHIFWVDERCVPPDRPESNYGMTKQNLLMKIKIPHENIHRIKGEADPFSEIERYSEEIKKILPSKNNLPCFDWILLGMGSDGHTASLFPGSELLKTSDNICGVAMHPVTGQKRVTLTLDVINNADRISFLVTGKDKAGTFKQIKKNEFQSQNYPASKINPWQGSLEWLVDEEVKEGNQI